MKAANSDFLGIITPAASRWSIRTDNARIGGRLLVARYHCADGAPGPCPPSPFEVPGAAFKAAILRAGPLRL